MTTIPHAEHGLAASYYDEYSSVELLASDLPPVISNSAKAGDFGATGLAKWTPVRYDRATNTLAAAVWNADPALAVLPNAVTSHNIDAGSSAESAVIVYVSGNFNPAALAWPASFDTAAKRAAAFDLATCQIQLTSHAFA